MAASITSATGVNVLHRPGRLATFAVDGSMSLMCCRPIALTAKLLRSPTMFSCSGVVKGWPWPRCAAGLLWCRWIYAVKPATCCPPGLLNRSFATPTACIKNTTALTRRAINVSVLAWFAWPTLSPWLKWRWRCTACLGPQVCVFTCVCTTRNFRCSFARPSSAALMPHLTAASPTQFSACQTFANA